MIIKIRVPLIFFALAKKIFEFKSLYQQAFQVITAILSGNFHKFYLAI